MLAVLANEKLLIFCEELSRARDKLTPKFWREKKDQAKKTQTLHSFNNITEK